MWQTVRSAEPTFAVQLASTVCGVPPSCGLALLLLPLLLSDLLAGLSPSPAQQRCPHLAAGPAEQLEAALELHLVVASSAAAPVDSKQQRQAEIYACHLRTKAHRSHMVYRLAD